MGPPAVPETGKARAAARLLPWRCSRCTAPAAASAPPPAPAPLLREPDACTRPLQEGLKTYYKAKIEEYEIAVRNKTQNLRRLEAQRNELNTKGASPLRAARRAALGAPQNGEPAGSTGRFAG